MAKEFIVSGDSHVVEPVDLYKTRLPKNMRDQALWEEDTILDEPLVPGGHTQFRTVHTAGYEGWTVSRYRQFPGPTPDGLPDSILRDLDRDGVDATMLFPNLSFFALYTDIHERSIAHARVYNDWLAETYLPYFSRLRAAAAIPTTDAADAVKEIERAVRLGLTTLILPEIPQPFPYWAPEYEPIWEAAEANGLPIFIHVASGGVDSKAGTSATGSQVKGILTAMTMGKQELDGALLAGRTMGGGSTAAASPMRIIADLVSAGVCERHPNLMFNVIEFNAGWLANYMGSMDKAWRTGTGQDPHWWLGFWDDGVDPHDQKLMGRMFKINERWPLPLKPSEYVKRNFR
ncbi:MAG TPA: amidohydrolase family protein, partial [Trebonia sp.]|nr:amidohydrolase family protein [Trebonia sp.]